MMQVDQPDGLDQPDGSTILCEMMPRLPL